MQADDVYREIEARKKRASDLGIRESVFHLYLDSLKHYPAWIRNLKDYVYPAVTEAIELGDGRSQFVVNGHKYTFGYVERSVSLPDDIYTVGTLSVFLEGDLVLEFEVNVNYPENEWDDTTLSTGDIKAFLEGPWVGELVDLAPKVRAHESQVQAKREKLAREDPAKLEDLKRRFGIS